MTVVEHFVGLLAKVWASPGISEFASALLGGGMTFMAQRSALKHDRKKEDQRRAEQQKAQAWSIFFKIHQAFELFTSIGNELSAARQMANENKLELWQIYQAPPHDPPLLNWENAELLFLLEKKQLELMSRYQQAVAWQANITQSLAKYREMRIELLNSIPSDMDGDQGSISLDESNRREIMPRIAHLRSLSDSIAAVVQAQAPDLRSLLLDYAKAMKVMVGDSPQIEFTELKAGQGDSGDASNQA